MPDRAALITGASSGIGLAIAAVLGQEGYGMTVAARRPDKLEGAADELRGKGYEIEAVPADMTGEDAVKDVVARHRERFGRLDMLVNNAGVGFGAPVAEIQTKRLDMQLNLNLRTVVLFYRETIGMLREAAAAHGQAFVINTASISGKSGQAHISVYSATKAAVVGFSEAMNKELIDEGIRSVALCPGFVDTPMTEWVKGEISAQTMIRPEDVAEAVRLQLRLSPNCLIPEIIFQRPGEMIL